MKWDKEPFEEPAWVTALGCLVAALLFLLALILI